MSFSFSSVKWQRNSSHTHTRLTALFPGLLGWASTRKVKPIWILLKQETVSGSGISWAVYMSATRSRQMKQTPPLGFSQVGCLSVAQPTASKHWRQQNSVYYLSISNVNAGDVASICFGPCVWGEGWYACLRKSLVTVWKVTCYFLWMQQHALIPQVRTEKRDGSTTNNPYVAFRRRTEKMQTRKVSLWSICS